MITSSFRPFGKSTGAALALAGRFSCRMLVLENTAVKIKKNTRITIMSIIGTMFRSSRPLVIAGVIAPDQAARTLIS